MNACRRTLDSVYVYKIRSLIHNKPLGTRPEPIAQLINESDKRNNIEIETHSHKYKKTRRIALKTATTTHSAESTNL